MEESPVDRDTLAEMHAETILRELRFDKVVSQEVYRTGGEGEGMNGKQGVGEDMESQAEMWLATLRAAVELGFLQAYEEGKGDSFEAMEGLAKIGDTRAIPYIHALMEQYPTTRYVEALVELGDFTGVQWVLEWIRRNNATFARGMEEVVARPYSPSLAPWTDDCDRTFVMDSARKIRPKLPADLRAQIDHVLETVTIAGLKISVHVEVLDLVPRVIYLEGLPTEYQEPIDELDLTPLSRCTKLRMLNISKNGDRTIDLSPLRECKALEYFECLNDEPFFLEISPLFDCPRLAVVKIDQPIFAQPHLKERRDIPQGILAIMDTIRWEKPDYDDFF